MGDVALEIPLRAFAVGRLGQRHDTGSADREMFGDSLDRPVLARPVAALQNDDDPLVGARHRHLGADQRELQRLQLLMIMFRHCHLLRAKTHGSAKVAWATLAV